MKLLVVSDTEQIFSPFEKRGQHYVFQSVEIEYWDASLVFSQFNIFYEYLLKNRFHLCLYYSAARILEEKNSLLNVVNQYATPQILRDIKQLSISKHPLFEKTIVYPSIVNRTTSYFNIFLEIEKGISLTMKPEDDLLELKRLDAIHRTNYHFGLACHLMSYPYYILNYNESLKEESNARCIEIIKLLD